MNDVEGASRVDAGRDRALCGFVGLVALAGSLSALQADGIVTPDATVVLAGILVLAAVALSITWRSAALRPSASSEDLVGRTEPAPPSGDAADPAMVIRELSRGLASLASGGLTARIAVAFPREYEDLRESFNDAMERNAESLALAGQRAAAEPIAFVADASQPAPAVVTRLPPSRRAAKVDLFAGRISEFIELRDARVSARQ